MKNRVIALIVFALLCSCLPATIVAEYGRNEKRPLRFSGATICGFAGCIILQRTGCARPDRGRPHSGRHRVIYWLFNRKSLVAWLDLDNLVAARAKEAVWTGDPSDEVISCPGMILDAEAGK